MTAPVAPRPAADRARPLIELRGVTVSYGPNIPPALSGVDLVIGRGEVVAVLGANGSGKSTLVRAILGLVPTIPAASATSTTRMGYVPQRQTVGGGVPATVEEVVATGRLLRRRLLPPLLPPVERGIVCDAIATVGLTEKIGSPVSELSGGQQRRALIARALASEPDVLLMDEPFAGVDTANQEILADTFDGLIQTGTTLVIVTHELGPIRGLVTRTVIVDHGQITYDGPPEGLPGGDRAELHDPCAHPDGNRSDADWSGGNPASGHPVNGHPAHGDPPDRGSGP